MLYFGANCIATNLVERLETARDATGATIG